MEAIIISPLFVFEVYCLCLLTSDILLFSFCRFAFLIFAFVFRTLQRINIVLFHVECLVRVTRLITCDEHPKKLTVAQAATSTSSDPSEVRSHLRQHLTLEISPFNHNNHRWSLTAGMDCDRLTRFGRMCSRWM